MQPASLSDDEIERRLPVWVILSELFLDTSFDGADYDRMADQLERSSFPVAEIERILREDVSPAFSWNLLQAAGEWAGWHEDDVRKIVASSVKRRSTPGMTALFKKLITPRIIPSDWTEIARRIESRRGAES